MELIFEDDDMRVAYNGVNSYLVHDKNKERSAHWDFVFADFPTTIPHLERLRLPMMAITMLFKKQSRKNVKGEGYEGRLKDTRKYAAIGSYYGRIVKGEVETDKGKNDISFIIMAPSQDQCGNSFN